MSTVRIFLSLLLALVIGSVATSCSSDDATAQKRVRRSLAQETTTSTKAQSTSSTVAAQSTTPIVEVPFLNAQQIPQTWTQANLCGLVSAAQAQTILKMTTAPTPEYSHSDLTGARCTFATGAGDEMYYELSSTSFTDARAVDTALQAQTTPIVVQGVGGVSKTNKATGTTYLLNVSGAASNQWIVNAPQDVQTNDLAKALISSLV